MYAVLIKSSINKIGPIHLVDTSITTSLQMSLIFYTPSPLESLFLSPLLCNQQAPKIDPRPDSQQTQNIKIILLIDYVLYLKYLLDPFPILATKYTHIYIYTVQVQIYHHKCTYTHISNGTTRMIPYDSVHVYIILTCLTPSKCTNTNHQKHTPPHNNNDNNM